MAKALGINSQYTGKLGNTVGSLQKVRYKAKRQVVKAYQPVVMNKQSYRQAVQRLRTKPLQKIYSAFRSILDRAFENSAYGQESHNRFLSVNMTNFAGPYVPKEYESMVPGPVQISEGSLPPINIYEVNYSGGATMARTSLWMPKDVNPTNFGNLCEIILDYNKYLKEGDEITFVYATIKDGVYYAQHYSVIIDTSISENDIHFGTLVNGDYKYITFLPYENDMIGELGAIGCIISRDGGEGSHLRSRSFFYCTGWVYPWCDDVAFMEACRSYLGDDQDMTDWPVDDIITSDKVAAAIQIIVTPDMPWEGFSENAIGETVLGFATKTGEIGVFYGQGATVNILYFVRPDGYALQVEDDGTMKKALLRSTYVPRARYLDFKY